MNSNNTIINYSTSGTGRCYIVLVEDDCLFEHGAEILSSLLLDLGQICFVKIKPIANDWLKSLEDLLEFIDSQGIRSASFIAFEDASVLVQALCLKRPRLLRTLVFVNGATRAHPSPMLRLFEKVENYLPLGLPFRSDFPGFDGKPFLQRIRCPVLVALTARADDYRKGQANLLLNGMPTSFLIELPEDNLEKHLAQSIRDFQTVPAKSPQKNIR